MTSGCGRTSSAKRPLTRSVVPKLVSSIAGRSWFIWRRMEDRQGEERRRAEAHESTELSELALADPGDGGYERTDNQPVATLGGRNAQSPQQLIGCGDGRQRREGEEDASTEKSKRVAHEVAKPLLTGFRLGSQPGGTRARPRHLRLPGEEASQVPARVVESRGFLRLTWSIGCRYRASVRKTAIGGFPGFSICQVVFSLRISPGEGLQMLKRLLVRSMPWLVFPALLLVFQAGPEQVVLGAAPNGEATRLLRSPTVSATQIAFAYANNIWVVERSGGLARRLTSFQGQTTNPHFSPDGRSIAFSGEYAGNTDVYVVPAEGGDPKRLTWHPGADTVQGWTPDGAAILFASGRASWAPNAAARFWTVAATGGVEEPMSLPRGYQGKISSGGTHIAYRMNSSWDEERRNYRGGQNRPIWIVDLKTYDLVSPPWTDSKDMDPVWSGDTVLLPVGSRRRLERLGVRHQGEEAHADDEVHRLRRQDD